MNQAACVLRAAGISKSFFGVHALRGVDLDLRAGEVHALVGQNGSGKSTLCKILSGLYVLDEGQLYVDGRPVEITDPHTARGLGIGLIPQEPLLVPLLSAPANIFLGREREFRRSGFLSRAEMKRRAAEALAELDYVCDLDVAVASLSLAAQEMIAMARVLVWNARVLILDEPTASLSRHEVETLFKTMDRLRKAGVSQVFISHRLEEVARIADRVTLLVDGLVRAEGIASDFPPRRLAELMVPEHDLTRSARLAGGRILAGPMVSEPALEVEGLRSGRSVQDVSFMVRFGEVVGLTGQVGSGKTETLRAIMGLDKAQAGTVSLFGRNVRLSGAAAAVRAGIGFLPEDRARSLVPLLPAADNILLSDLPRVSRLGFVRRASRQREAGALQSGLDIATPGQIFRPVRNLSGGNQQKVGVARWIFKGSRALIFDEPTRGIDIGTKARVHELIRRLAREGRAVLVSSSDFEEVVDVCDRALVMKHGEIAAELSGEQLTEREIVACAL
jgi:ABC-type sugar transport system ATPase subunit